MSYAVCSKCKNVVDSLDAGFDLAIQNMECACGGRYVRGLRAELRERGSGFPEHGYVIDKDNNAYAVVKLIPSTFMSGHDGVPNRKMAVVIPAGDIFDIAEDDIFPCGIELIDLPDED